MKKRECNQNRMLPEEHLGAAIFGFMTLLAGINIVSRVVVNFSFAFSEELEIYLFVVATILGASAGVYRGLHMGLTIVADAFKGRARLFFILMSAVASVILYAVLAWQGFLLAESHIRYAYVTPVMQIPQWVFSSSLCYGALLYIYRVVQDTIQKVKEVLAA
jgi:TRAP-type C4-dicarboxylate transport system permease small subunit